MRFRYSRWDGSQNLSDLDADDLLAAMSDDLMSDGDLWSALRRMFQCGTQDPQGQRMPGLQDLLDRPRKRRQEQLNRYDLSSALDDIKKKLDEILKTERAGIDRDVKEPAAKAQKLDRLDKLPPEPAGRIKELQDYNFTDPAVAAMDVTGQLTALSVGFTTLQVIFRDNDNDPTDDDTPIGDLPGHEQGSFALIVAGAGWWVRPRVHLR